MNGEDSETVVNEIWWWVVWWRTGGSGGSTGGSDNSDKLIFLTLILLYFQIILEKKAFGMTYILIWHCSMLLLFAIHVLVSRR